MKNFFKTINSNFKINIIFNAIYQILVFIVPLITTPYISTVFSTEIIGSYSYAYSIVIYFGLAAGFGFSIFGVSEIAKFRDNLTEKNKVFWSIFFAKSILGVLISIVYFLLCFGNIFYSPEYSANTLIIYLIFGIEVIANIFDITYLLQGEERFTTICLRNIAIKSLTAICIFLFIKTNNDYTLYVLIMSLSVFLTYFSLLISLPKSVKKPVFCLKDIGHMYIKAFPYFIPFISTTIFPIISKSLLGIIGENSIESGFYEQADKIINIIVTLIGSLNTIIMSRFSYLIAKSNNDEIARKIRKTFQLYSLLSFSCFFGLIAINNFFTLGFFGLGYDKTILLIYILAPKIFFSPLSNLLGAMYYVPYQKLSQRNIFIIVSLLLSILLNAVFIYYFGSIGAAIASSLVEGILFFLYIFGCFRKIDFSVFKTEIIKCLLPASAMCLIIFLLKNPLLDITTAIFANINIYSDRIIYIFVAGILIFIGIISYFFMLLLIKEPLTYEIIKNLLTHLKFRKSNKK